MQYFRVKMKCGHYHDIPAVDRFEGKPYVPNFIGQDMPTRCGGGCVESHKVVAQRKMGGLTGTYQEIESDKTATWTDA